MSDNWKDKKQYIVKRTDGGVSVFEIRKGSIKDHIKKWETAKKYKAVSHREAIAFTAPDRYFREMCD